MIEGLLAGVVADRAVGAAPAGDSSASARRRDRTGRVAAALAPTATAVREAFAGTLADRLDALATAPGRPTHALRRVASRRWSAIEGGAGSSPDADTDAGADSGVGAGAGVDTQSSTDATTAAGTGAAAAGAADVRTERGAVTHVVERLLAERLPIDDPTPEEGLADDPAVRRAVATAFASAAATARDRVEDASEAPGQSPTRAHGGDATGGADPPGANVDVDVDVDVDVAGGRLAGHLDDVRVTFERLAGDLSVDVYDFPAEREAAVAAVDTDRETAFVDRPAVPDRPAVGRHVVVGPAGAGKSRVVAERLARLPAEAVDYVVVPAAGLLDGADVQALADATSDGDVLLVWDLGRAAVDDGRVGTLLERLERRFEAAGVDLYTLLEVPVDTDADADADADVAVTTTATAATTATSEADATPRSGRSHSTADSSSATDWPAAGADPPAVDWSELLPSWVDALGGPDRTDPLWVGELDEPRRRRLAARTAERYGVALDEAARDALAERTAGSTAAPAYLAAAMGTAGTRLDAAGVRALPVDTVGVWAAEYDRLRAGTSAEWRVLAAMTYLAELRVPQYARLVRAVFASHLDSDRRRFRTAVRSLADRGWLVVMGEAVVGRDTRYWVHDAQLAAVDVGEAGTGSGVARDIPELLRDRLDDDESVPTAVRAPIHVRCSRSLAAADRHEAAADHWARAAALAPAATETHAAHVTRLIDALDARVAADRCGWTVATWLRAADRTVRDRGFDRLPRFVRACDDAGRPGVALDLCTRGLALSARPRSRPADGSGTARSPPSAALTASRDGGSRSQSQSRPRSRSRPTPVGDRLRATFATLSARSPAARAPELYRLGLDALRANHRGPAADALTRAWRLRREVDGPPPTDVLAAGVWCAASRATVVEVGMVDPAFRDPDGTLAVAERLPDRPVVAALARAVFADAEPPDPIVLRERGERGYYGLERDALIALLSA